MHSPPPPPPHSPPPDMPPPPPGPPPPVNTEQKITLSESPNTYISAASTLLQNAKFQFAAKGRVENLLATSRLELSPVTQERDVTSKISSDRREKKQEDDENDKEDDIGSYLDESDVFEEDVEAILFAEEEEDRRKGYIDCLSETHLDSAEYPYPAYLGKLATLFTEQNAFGKSPEGFIYCNNLLISSRQLKLIDAKTAALEKEKWIQVRRTAALKVKEDEKRRHQERLVEALEPPAKQIKISESAIKALECKHPKGKTKVSGKTTGAPNSGSVSKKVSSHTKKNTINAARATTKAVASGVKATRAAKKKRVKLNTITNFKEANVEAELKKSRAEGDDERGNESSSSSSSFSSSSSSSSVNSSSSSSSSPSSRLSLSSSSSGNDTGAI
ncbi:hypothetical protein PsorP6_000016 [Peronosclerospora sorghi]|uniref:Uncharacterized protein n=1 Tax=Peronosclerospora sorghi TaxID=230839 RepID=A0ACC0WT98_9STRA|nr:hypothetical protein PsorP6_000016 [Peronosclerospora sorghi]